MQNMGWIKSPLATTDSFTIKSGVSGGVYFIDGVSESVTATPTLLPDLMSFGSPEISRTSDTVNAKIDWTVNVKFDSNSLDQTGYIYLTIPDQVVYDMGETLTTVLTSNSSASTGNSKTLYTSGAINIINLTSVCGSSGCASGSTLTVMISWFKNPPAVYTVTSSIQINSATSQGWIIDQGTGTAINSLFSALVKETITSVDISPSDPSAGAVTNYDIIFTANTDIPQNSYVVITLPSDVTISSTNSGGSTSLDTCGNLFDSTVTLTCTVGTDSSGNTIVTVTGLFPDSTNSGQFGVDIGLLVNPSTTGSTGSFGIDIYTPTGDSVASESSGSSSNSATINTAIDPSSCTSPCATCSGTSTTCSSCSNPSNYPFLQGSS